MDKRKATCIMKELWEGCGYADLKLSKQNLRDQAANFEKTLGSVSQVIGNSVGSRDCENQAGRNEENINSNLEQHVQDESLHIPNQDMHTECIQSRMSGLHESATEILSTINGNKGDFAVVTGHG